MFTYNYFDLNTLNNLTKPFVRDELEKLQKEIYKITKRNATLIVKEATDSELSSFEFKPKYDETYLLAISYINKVTKRKVNNVFCLINYSETYPVIVKFLKDESEAVECKYDKEFHEYLKKICNNNSVLCSLILSLRKKKDYLSEKFK